MLQIIFSSCKEHASEFVGRVACASFVKTLSYKTQVDNISDSCCLVTFDFDVDWSWRKSQRLIFHIQSIADYNILSAEVIGVLYH